VLRKLSGKDETNGSLDLTRRNGGLLVVRCQLRGLSSDPLENIIDEGVEDEHGLVRDTSVGVDLLEDLVDVRRVGFLADALLLLLVTLSGRRLLDSLLGGSFSSGGLGGGGLSSSGSGLLLFVSGSGE
jgi:hypothetical protein